jgi:UDP-glucose 4-epimerase
VRVLVTGGRGYLGHAVTGRLADDGHQPIVMTSRPDGRSLVNGVEVIHVDIRDRDQLRSIVVATEPAGACHLAALTRVRGSFDSPVDYYDVNVGGTIGLLAALGDLGPLPLVFASTGAVHGPCEGHIREDQPTRPTNPYGATKLAAEELLLYHAATGAIGTVILRCFNIAGAVDGVGDRDTTRIIPKALAVAAGQADHLGINGDGSAIREFIHVADVATAIAQALIAARTGEAHTYNVGSGVESTMLDVVTAVEAATGQPIPVQHNPPKPEPAVLVADSTRIRQDLCWQPHHSTIEEIVHDAWSAVRQQPRGDAG